MPTAIQATSFCARPGMTIKLDRLDEAAHASCGTKDTILEIYDEMAECIAASAAASGDQRVGSGEDPTTGHSPLTARPNRVYQTRLDPPPGPPADAEGNFLPLPQWLPGQPRPADWPSHIHGPKEVYDRAKANNIGWRSFLKSTDAPTNHKQQNALEPRR